ncbi:MAG: hypothetical protein A3B86_01240 [Candidatus Yanofskybacteria bacterium RIFCSPHIGHO2_02_FULL_38_22b]|uniref:Uncharacterized protein n=1 Tax=Candidatus Yanofskybacteria bacterium RIFCSPHIGHO2_02_FULL_38_22b TaxID=1802673 RepID=A0A1F8F3W3_9BACT|nr:MAG: hypothetical protein A3B86_01240 [Candidatus Yanofskybacteria bacterium RIFCSPHIGHO2_02_FULL_38_22b]OGN20413.1 MAG: hypothetical protein A2910_01590 [Candidatus Yanofskybacteria bacterium RIFCSPLOWO2_01_FULL_39_28]
MSENKKRWEKEILDNIHNLDGGNQNPFETPLGPTKECLTANQVVAYVKNGTREPKVVEHISKCSFCNKRIDNLSNLINHLVD